MSLESVTARRPLRGESVPQITSIKEKSGVYDSGLERQLLSYYFSPSLLVLGEVEGLN